MEEQVLVKKKTLRWSFLFEKVMKGEMTLKTVSVLIGKSYRQSRRLYRKYIDHGIVGLQHGNKGKEPSNKLSFEVSTQIMELSENRYKDFNDVHFTEKLNEEGISVSRESVRKLRRKSDVKPKHKRRAKKHRSRRTPCESPGMLVQCDGSPHKWFGDGHPACCLMSAVDDSDKRLLAAYFVKQEGSESYLRLFDRMLRKHGIPMAVYHDRHTSLVRGDNSWTEEEIVQGYQYPTHVGRVLDELGIESISAYSPQAKGRVERAFRTLQDRLIAELGLRGITSIEEANLWLENEFIDYYNKKFATTPVSNESVFMAIDEKTVFNTVAFAYESIVGKDNTVKLGGLVIDIPQNDKVDTFAGKTVLVKQHLDGSWSVWWNKIKVAEHPVTVLREPIRTWKRKSKSRVKEDIQVYISSKPARPMGHNRFAVEGTY